MSIGISDGAAAEAVGLGAALDAGGAMVAAAPAVDAADPASDVAAANVWASLELQAASTTPTALRAPLAAKPRRSSARLVARSNRGSSIAGHARTTSCAAAEVHL